MPKLTGIKHLFFDLDHTLWDFDQNSAKAFEAIFIKNNVDVPLPAFLETYLPINRTYWKYYRENRITKAQLRYSRLSKSFKALGYRVDDQLINRLSQDYIIYLARYNALFPGALMVLKTLSQRYVLHIITNGFEEVQHLKLKNSKIEDFFSTVTTSEAVGTKKPDSKIFKHALNVAGATAIESLMIGDNYEADILGALQVGMKAICFNYHREDLKQLEHVIYQLDELLKIL